MSENKFFDFDAYMDERKNVEKPFIIRAFGEDHKIPNDVPFDIILKIQRDHKDGNAEITEAQTVEMCKMIFGETTFDKWLKSGIGLNGIMFLMEKVMGMYMADASETTRKTTDEKLSNSTTP